MNEQETPQIKGIVESKSITGTGETPGKGKWTRYLFTIDGKDFSCFNEQKLFERIQIGDYVKVEGKQNGVYFNMTNLVKIEKKIEEQKPNFTSKIPQEREREISIDEITEKDIEENLRLECLKLAVSISNLSVAEPAELNCERAEKYYKFVKG